MAEEIYASATPVNSLRATKHTGLNPPSGDFPAPVIAQNTLGSAATPLSDNLNLSPFRKINSIKIYIIDILY